MSKILSVLDPFAYDGEFTGLSRMYIKQGTQELHDEIRGFWEGNGLDEVLGPAPRYDVSARSAGITRGFRCSTHRRLSAE